MHNFFFLKKGKNRGINIDKKIARVYEKRNEITNNFVGTKFRHFNSSSSSLKNKGKRKAIHLC